jgi:hypothetical protein
MVELGQPPINQPQLPLSVVNENIEGLHVAMYDALGVTEVEGLEQLVHVVALVGKSLALASAEFERRGAGRGQETNDIAVRELGVEDFGIEIVDMLEDLSSPSRGSASSSSSSRRARPNLQSPASCSAGLAPHPAVR